MTIILFFFLFPFLLCHMYERKKNDNIDIDYCKGRETLQNLCEQIAGDALLYSLFKENAEPVKCPLRGTSNKPREYKKNEST